MELNPYYVISSLVSDQFLDPCFSLFTCVLWATHNVLQSLGIPYHFYADDSQIYITFKPDQADLVIAKSENAVETRTAFRKRLCCKINAY